VRLQSWFDAAAELVLGSRCSACELPGLNPCPACRAALRGSRPVVLRGPGDPPLVVVAGGSYEAATKAVLLAAKERSGLGLVPVLAERLAVAVTVLASARPAGRLLLVPMPSVPARVAERGVDFTAAMAARAAGQLRRVGVPVTVVRALRQVRRPADQSGLGVAARQSNLAGAFAAAATIPDGELIVVDDIVTTGASIAEAIRALTAMGRRPVGAATVAATRRHRVAS
jgi:predicted amidophosphoribosyltransferase